MTPRVFRYHRDWELEATPEALWSFIANTHLVNYVSQTPAVQMVNETGERPLNGYHRVRASITEYEEKPFEWIRPFRFSSTKRFLKARIFDELGSGVELTPKPGGGTSLHYYIWATPPNVWLTPIVPLMLRRILNAFDAPIRQYDRLAVNTIPTTFDMPAYKVHFAPGGEERLAELTAVLSTQADPVLAQKLQTILQKTDDLLLARIRPYALADYWGVPRRQVLDLCLQAVRLGLLEMFWEILCPLCRGAKQTTSKLADLNPNLHCATCNIDFTANFARSVELVFRPNPSVRLARIEEFCVGGPQLTPHIVVQQLLAPGERRLLTLPLEEGRYRVRVLELPGSQAVIVAPQAKAAWEMTIQPNRWTDEEIVFGLQTELEIHNAMPQENLFMLERTAWSDQATTGAEVIALQSFRDLFAEEALRANQQISVGSMAILFTDLRDSTRLYQEWGDAVAFGRVLSHFEVLKQVVQTEDGAIVKTIGDAIMGVFVRPLNALRAILIAQKELAHPPDGLAPLALKAGLHMGPCIAVTLNGRLDYFGSTVNMASRLESLSASGGCVISGEVYHDLEVQAYLAELGEMVQVEPVQATLKGFEDLTIELWRIQLK